MRIVKCYDCGKRYNYDEDGFCPECGSFNQPKALSRIGADGSVVWVDGINRRNHEGSFVHAELHEENRDRRGSLLEQEGNKRKSYGKRAAPKQAVIRQPLAGQSAQTTPQKKGGSVVFMIILIIIVLNVLANLTGMLYW